MNDPNTLNHQHPLLVTNNNDDNLDHIDNRETRELTSEFLNKVSTENKNLFHVFYSTHCLSSLIDSLNHNDVSVCKCLLETLASFSSDLCIYLLCTLKFELDSHQFQSLLHLSTEKQQSFINLTYQLKENDRVSIFQIITESNIDLEELIHFLESPIETQICQVCKWKKDVRKTIIRNQNQTEEMARESAGQWKMIEFPHFGKVFELCDDGEKLFISFSELASSFVCVNRSVVIDGKNLCTSCRKEVHSFVLSSSKGDENTKMELHQRRSLEKKIAKWFRADKQHQEINDLKSAIITAQANVSTIEETRSEEENNGKNEQNTKLIEYRPLDERTKISEKKHEKKWQDSKLKLLQLFALLQFEMEYGDTVDVIRHNSFPWTEIHPENGIPLTREAASILFGTAVNIPKEKSSDLKQYLNFIRNAMKRFQQQQEETTRKEELAHQNEMHDLKQKLLEDSKILEEKVTIAMQQQRELEERKRKERMEMKHLKRQQRQQMELEAQQRKAEEEKLENERREFKRHEEALEKMEMMRMRNEEEEQTKVDRFWGLITEMEEERRMEEKRRNEFEQQVLLFHAMMLVVGGQKDENIDLSEILGIPEYLLKKG